MGLMARGNLKVNSDDSCSSDDDSENELSPRDLKLLLDEYNDMIKKLKSKLKFLKNVQVELKTLHDELLVRHNDVVETL